MVFLHPQFLHSLLPQGQDSQANQALGEEISQSHQEYFGLLKQEIEDLAELTSSKNNQLRKQLDAIPRIQKANQQRS